jgi:GNAT superfamily N-acetyltransferase
MGSYYHRTPQTVTEHERSALIQLVEEGGAATAAAVERGIPRCEAMVFCAQGDQIVGVGALKVPQPNYRDGIAGAAKSGFPLPPAKFARELGYVAVAVAWRGRGIGPILCNQLIALAAGRSLFATTGDDTMRHKILPRLGFVQAGASWKGRAEQVFLMVLDQG